MPLFPEVNLDKARKPRLAAQTAHGPLRVVLGPPIPKNQTPVNTNLGETTSGFRAQSEHLCGLGGCRADYRAYLVAH